MPSTPDFVEPHWLAQFSISGGRLARFRHVVPEDEPLIVEAISTATRETLLHRFFGPIRHVSPELLRKMLAIDRTKELCLVGLVQDGAHLRLICGARYIRLPRKDAAEIALTVHDDFQKQGLGTFMVNLIMQLALSQGIRWFEADVMSSNAGMLKLLHRVSPGNRESFRTGDVQHIVVSLESLAKE